MIGKKTFIGTQTPRLADTPAKRALVASSLEGKSLRRGLRGVVLSVEQAQQSRIAGGRDKDYREGWRGHVVLLGSFGPATLRAKGESLMAPLSRKSRAIFHRW